MLRTCRRMSLLAAVATLALPAVADARNIGSSGASGDYAVAVASGTATNPHSLWVKVTSSPHQRVSVSWTVVCSRGFGAGSKSGQFTARTTTRRKLRLPMRHPDNCTASASAQLESGSGHLRVTMQAY
jgi:hypothetical protein